MTASATPAPSPCRAICRLDERDICTGCHRTLDEIRRWRDMDDGERRQVLAALSARASAE